MLVFTLSACGKNESPNTNNQGTQSNNDSNISAPGNSSGSTTEDLIKTITVETAEAKGLCGADLTWYYQDNVLIIKGTGEMANWEDAITPYMPWHAAGIANQIVHIYIEDGVESIGDCAFSFFYSGYNCAVSKVVVGKDLARIGSGAFAGSRDIEFEFKGDVPEGMDEALYAAKSVYYSSDTFDELVNQYPDINWVKQ